jgi:hypothetical protein
MLYFLATFIAAFGIFGLIYDLSGASEGGADLGILFGLGLLVAGVIIFVSLRQRVPQLRVAHFLWGILGVTVAMFMALVLAVDRSFGFIILIYGVVLAATCLW